MKNTENNNNNKSLLRLRITIQSIAISTGFISGIIIAYIYNKEALQNSFFWLSSIVWVCVIVTIVLYSTYGNTNKEVDDYYNTAKSAINRDSFNIIDLMLLNMKEIKEYYVLSKKMAKRSFALSVVFSILGFCIIATSIIAIFVTDVSIAETLIPVIGGTVIELIAGTTLVVYKKSLEQLNHYYNSLHNNERFLSLVNLVDKMSKDKKDETYLNIINSQLETLKNFQ